MRSQRQKIKLLEMAEADENDIISARCRYRKTMSDYVDFSTAMGIPQQRERVYSDKQGKVGVGKTKKRLKNAAGHSIIEVKQKDVKITGEPNSITQTQSRKGGITRNYYDANGRQKKQVSNNDHGHKAESGYGKHGEHAHDYLYGADGKLTGRPVRELTEEERKENEDIL